jgi:hypothetical protein
MEITETFLAYGHGNIRATHKTTLEITKERNLTKKGDCIVAVSANKALADLNCEFKENLCKENAKLTILIEAGAFAETIRAKGSPRLVMSHPTDMVIRKSRYISDRTLAIDADKAAHDLSRKLIEKMKNSKQAVKITLTIRV